MITSVYRGRFISLCVCFKLVYWVNAANEKNNKKTSLMVFHFSVISDLHWCRLFSFIFVKGIDLVKDNSEQYLPISSSTDIVWIQFEFCSWGLCPFSYISLYLTCIIKRTLRTPCISKDIICFLNYLRKAGLELMPYRQVYTN